MYEYIQGSITILNPTYAVVDNSGIGYRLHISINTYTALKLNTNCQLYVEQVIREDSNQLYGFATINEREMFRLLIGVSGIGANTARVILSSMSAEELSSAITTENIHQLQSIKGIGAKTAQRIVIELKDKVVKINIEPKNTTTGYNTLKEEALSALIMLGFAKAQVQKALDSIMKSNNNLTLEDMVKQALKVL